MNIFKILSSGDGKIHEPSISAFLGYLLDPLESHGLRAELLFKFLDCLDEKHNLRNIKIEVKVLLEQAFKTKENNQKAIVDIVVLIYKIETNKKESQAKALLALDKEKSNFLERIILIENKISDSSITEGQSKSQYDNALSELKKLLGTGIENKISYIFVTPFKSGEDEFNNFRANKSASHIHWNIDEEDGDEFSSSYVNSISGFLKEILNDEGLGKIEAIDEYAKHTVKSFINFIDSGFKSRLAEKTKGEFKREIWYDFSGFRQENENQELLEPKSWNELEEFLSKVNSLENENLKIRYSRNHIISIFVNDEERKDGKKIFSISKSGKKLILHLVIRNHKISKTKIQNEFAAYQLKDKDYHFELEYNKETAFDIFKKHLEIIKNAN